MNAPPTNIPPLIDASNFPLWLMQMKEVLRPRGLLPYVDGRNPAPYRPEGHTATFEKTPDYALWAKADGRAKEVLIAHVHPCITKAVSKMATARLVMVLLEMNCTDTLQKDGSLLFEYYSPNPLQVLRQRGEAMRYGKPEPWPRVELVARREGRKWVSKPAGVACGERELSLQIYEARLSPEKQSRAEEAKDVEMQE